MCGAGFALGRLTEEGHGIGNGFTGKPEFAVAVNNVVKDEAGFVGSAEAGEEGGGAGQHHGKASAVEELCRFDGTGPKRPDDGNEILDLRSEHGSLCARDMSRQLECSEGGGGGKAKEAKKNGANRKKRLDFLCGTGIMA